MRIASHQFQDISERLRLRDWEEARIIVHLFIQIELNQSFHEPLFPTHIHLFLKYLSFFPLFYLILQLLLYKQGFESGSICHDSNGGPPRWRGGVLTVNWTKYLLKYLLLKVYFSFVWFHLLPFFLTSIMCKSKYNHFGGSEKKFWLTISDSWRCPSVKAIWIDMIEQDRKTWKFRTYGLE